MVVEGGRPAINGRAGTTIRIAVLQSMGGRKYWNRCVPTGQEQKSMNWSGKLSADGRARSNEHYSRGAPRAPSTLPVV